MLGDDRVHGLGDDAVLERRLIEVVDVIHDDVASGRLEGLDVCGEAGLAAERRGEVELGARRDLVDDLQHGRALAGRAVAVVGLARQDGDRSEGACPLGLAQIVHTVGQDADLDAGTRRAERLPGEVRPVGEVPFRVGGVGRWRRRRLLPGGLADQAGQGVSDGRETGGAGRGAGDQGLDRGGRRAAERDRVPVLGGLDELDVGLTRQRLQLEGGDQGAEGVILRETAFHGAARRRDGRQQGRRHGPFDVHLDQPGRVGLDAGAEGGDTRRDFPAGRHAPGLEQIGVQPLLGGGPVRLLAEEGADLGEGRRGGGGLSRQGGVQEGEAGWQRGCGGQAGQRQHGGGGGEGAIKKHCVLLSFCRPIRVPGSADGKAKGTVYLPGAGLVNRCSRKTPDPCFRVGRAHGHEKSN